MRCADSKSWRSTCSSRRRQQRSTRLARRSAPSRLPFWRAGAPRAPGEHLGGVSPARLGEGAGVNLQRRFVVAEAALVLAQDLRAHLDVDLGLEQGVLAAVVEELVEVVLW